MKHISTIAPILYITATLLPVKAQDLHSQPHLEMHTTSAVASKNQVSFRRHQQIHATVGAIPDSLYNCSHDIKSLSKWGPYSKQYAGISYIEDISGGKRIDFTTVPGLYRRSYSIPDVLFESGCHPWKVTPDMKKITYRYDLEWKDRVYVDVCYKVIDSLAVSVEMHCVNNSETNQNLLLYNLMSLHYADDFPMRRADVPEGVTVVKGCDYVSFEPGHKGHDYNLVYDGWKRGEERTGNSTGGSLLNLGGNWHHGGGPLLDTSEEVNDKVVYDFVSETDIPDAEIAVECRIPLGAAAEICVSGICENTLSKEDFGPDNGDFRMVTLGKAHIVKGHNMLSITNLNGCNIKIDALYAGSEEDVQKVRISGRRLKYRPEVEKREQEVIARYDELDNLYAIAWDYGSSEIREFENSELDTFMRKAVHRHPPKYFSGDKKGHFVSSFLRPIFLTPYSDTTIVSLLATGNREEIERNIAQYREENVTATRKYNDIQDNTQKDNDVHKISAASKTTESPKVNEAQKLNEVPKVADAQNFNDVPERINYSNYLPGADRYALGKQLLEATILTNIVYPVYTQGEYIRHFTPGKNWNSLYTWDEGCISLSLNEIDPVKAFETIRAYTTDDNSQSAFIHHGTPLPIQFFAFSELCNNLSNKPHDKLSGGKLIEWMYPRLKRYYDFITGRDSTSTMMMSSGLIRTWDYFYSSGGWDDYPPQHRLRTDTQLYRSVTPCVSTSYYARAAKILRGYAERLGLKKDIRQYDKDIELFTSALQKYAWDEECGYFSYVLHDENGTPNGIYRHSDGSNFNQGLDGASPLVGGCCTEIQKSTLIGKLFSPEHLWTDIGISTVDKSASYYDPTGYWNGSVWIPHQYFLWKSLLDCGETELAYRLAHTILDTWEKECEESHYCFEHFIISSGRGAGWHNFSGLSSPVINLFNSYYKTGHIATGFDTSILEYTFNGNFSQCSATLSFDKSSIGQRKTLIVCMNPDYEYEVNANGKPATCSSPYPGLLEIELTATKKPVLLDIKSTHT